MTDETTPCEAVHPGLTCEQYEQQKETIGNAVLARVSLARLTTHRDGQDLRRHPDVTVQLTGIDSNAMNIIAAVTKALRRAGYGSQTREFVNEATAGDYNHVIQTAMQWVNVE